MSEAIRPDRCETCRFCVPTDEDGDPCGECHRLPPHMADAGAVLLSLYQSAPIDDFSSLPDWGSWWESFNEQKSDSSNAVWPVLQFADNGAWCGEWQPNLKANTRQPAQPDKSTDVDRARRVRKVIASRTLPFRRDGHDSNAIKMAALGIAWHIAKNTKSEDEAEIMACEIKKFDSRQIHRQWSPSRDSAWNEFLQWERDHGQ